MKPTSQPKKIPSLNYGKPSAQQGVVLIVGLVLLLLMTLIGTTGMQSTSLEEKMAGNMRDRNLAFQAAESALAAGENYLETVATIPSPFCDKSEGRYDRTTPDCAAIADPVWEEIDWDDGDSVEYTGELSNLSAPPRYIIEDMSCTTPPCAAGTHNYRITARATGGSVDAVVILQSVYQI